MFPWITRPEISTCLLARLGMATLFAGMNPNPLSDLNPAISGERQDQANQANAHQPDPFKTISNPAEETIEPIQVETLPPPTKEPPVNIDDDDWASILDAVKSQMGTTADHAPSPMPYAEENADAKAISPDVTGAVETISRSLNASMFLWLFSLAPLQVPQPDVVAPAQPNDPSAKADFSRNDTMEFRPSDAGRYPLVIGSPF